MQKLSCFKTNDFSRGASSVKELLWKVTQALFFNLNFIRGYVLKSFFLQAFGAKLGVNNVWKPFLKVTFPWRLKVGNDCWFGEEVWILNLANVEIGNDVCISQRAFICTGSHDWRKHSFDLITSRITIGNGVWICSNVFIGPGVTIGDNTVITAGSVVSKDLPPNMICSGNPCVPIKMRENID